jgi:hypothetical protein
LISKQVEIIEKNIWKEIELINIYSKEIKSWIIKKYQNETIYFLNWETYSIDEWEIKSKQ